VIRCNHTFPFLCSIHPFLAHWCHTPAPSVLTRRVEFLSEPLEVPVKNGFEWLLTRRVEFLSEPLEVPGSALLRGCPLIISQLLAQNQFRDPPTYCSFLCYAMSHLLRGPQKESSKIN
jgi:hypothetical protein